MVSFHFSGPKAISSLVKRHSSRSPIIASLFILCPIKTTSCLLSSYSYLSPLGFVMSLRMFFSASSSASHSISHIQGQSGVILQTFPAPCQQPMMSFVVAIQQKPLLLNNVPNFSSLFFCLTKVCACISSISFFFLSSNFCLASSNFFFSSSVFSVSSSSSSSKSSSNSYNSVGSAKY